MKMFPHQFELQNTRLFRVLICLGALFCLTASTHAIGVCTTNKFNTSLLNSVGSNPRQVITGDLDDNGGADLVVISGSSYGSSNTATVLLNDRRGNFTTFNSLSFNFTINGAALVDFNQDGALDLAVTGTNSSGGGSSTSSLVIYFNNGSGVFSSQNTYTFPGSVTGLATGDIDSNGTIDIALTNSSGNTFGSVTVFLNNNFGNFSLAGNFSVGGLPRAIAIADFNGDGAQDIVTINTNATGSILSGSGTGNFQVANNFNVTTNYSSFFQISLAVGDLNNDTRPDLVVAGGDSSSFYTLLNNAGNFSSPVQSTFSNFDFRVRSITIGQILGDGNVDIAVAGSGSYSDAISATALLAGNGSGTFSTTNATYTPTGISPSFIALADLNGDGRNDLVTTNSTSNDVSVLLNNGFDKFGPNTFLTNPTPGVIAAADFNGDGNLDVATASTQAINGNNLLLSFGNGTGGVSGTQTVGLTNGVLALIAADVNNDSRADLIAATGSNTGLANTIFVFLNTGNAGIFSSPPSTSFTVNFNIRAFAIGDFNNDGRRDLIATSQNSNSIAILLGTADGVFAAPTTFAVPVSNPVTATGDFNNDGKLDLAVAGSASNGAGAVFILAGNGNGGFTQLTESIAVNTPTSIAAGDFNGDSILDIAVTNLVNFSSVSVVSVALGIGNGRFGQLTTYPVGNDARSLTAVDFNGDNKPDLIVANRTSNSVSVLTNIGNGNFTQAANFLAGIFPEQLAVGDFNNDGRNEIATVNRGGGNFSLINNTCQETVTKTDYNGEGKSDFAVFRPSTGTWLVLSNDLTVSRSQQFGLNGDIPTPGDFDGDGITDFAVFRPSNGTWYILRSSTNRTLTIQFGSNGDVPVANDFDGDGRTDIAVFRPSNGTWYIRRGLTSQSQFNSFQFGNNLDRPVPADYDGDGRADLAVYRNGLWVILRSSNLSVSYQQFGIASDIPLVGDYDGDGKSDLAVYRGGVWYILQSRTNSLRAESFGEANDRPQPADYDGDGRTDIAVFRASENNWYILRSSDRQIRAINWGMSNDVPVSSLYRY